MLSRAELQKLANRERVGLGALEKDYVLTHVLNNLSAVDELATLFVFKGGTALRKIYFPGWRYSEDLDFTVKKARFSWIFALMNLFAWNRHTAE